MSPVSYFAAAYLLCGLWIALTEHRGCRGFVVTTRKRALANIAVMTVGWLPKHAVVFLMALVAAFVDFSDEEASR